MFSGSVSAPLARKINHACTMYASAAYLTGLPTHVQPLVLADVVRRSGTRLHREGRQRRQQLGLDAAPAPPIPAMAVVHKPPWAAAPLSPKTLHSRLVAASSAGAWPPIFLPVQPPPAEPPPVLPYANLAAGSPPPPPPPPLSNWGFGGGWPAARLVLAPPLEKQQQQQQQQKQQKQQQQQQPSSSWGFGGGWPAACLVLAPPLEQQQQPLPPPAQLPSLQPQRVPVAPVGRGGIKTWAAEVVGGGVIMTGSSERAWEQVAGLSGLLAPPTPNLDEATLEEMFV